MILEHCAQRMRRLKTNRADILLNRREQGKMLSLETVAASCHIVELYLSLVIPTTLRLCDLDWDETPYSRNTEELPISLVFSAPPTKLHAS